MSLVTNEPRIGFAPRRLIRSLGAAAAECRRHSAFSWAFNAGILGAEIAVVIENCGDAMNGRTRMTSTVAARVTVETRTTFRATVPRQRRKRSLYFQVVVVGPPNAPRAPPRPVPGPCNVNFAVE